MEDEKPTVPVPHRNLGDYLKEGVILAGLAGGVAGVNALMPNSKEPASGPLDSAANAKFRQAQFVDRVLVEREKMERER